jgi:hypothetical protein
MAKLAPSDRQADTDRRQVRQHFVHWGVKTVATLVFAAIAFAIWLGWKLLSGSPP